MSGGRGTLTTVACLVHPPRCIRHAIICRSSRAARRLLPWPGSWARQNNRSALRRPRRLHRRRQHPPIRHRRSRLRNQPVTRRPPRMVAFAVWREGAPGIPRPIHGRRASISGRSRPVPTSPPCTAASTSGPRQDSGHSYTSRSYTVSASSARSTGPRGRWTRSASGPKRGDETCLNPVDRGKPGSKISILCDRRGVPLTVLVSAANVPDAHLLVPLVDSITSNGWDHPPTAWCQPPGLEWHCQRISSRSSGATGDR